MEDEVLQKVNFKYYIGQQLQCKKSVLTITNKEVRVKRIQDKRYNTFYNNYQKWYKYTCNKCGYSNGWRQENQMLLSGCPCCSGNVIVEDINSFGAYYPHLLLYFVDKNDAFKIGHGSKKDVFVECPLCHNQRYINAYFLAKRGFVCNKCSDHISYPEKFMMSFLNQCNVKYIYQLSKKDFQWCEKFKYDFYLPDYNCIIETNGEQHYGNAFTCANAKSYAELLSDDLEKKALAVSNGIEYYEWIDCSKSDADTIVKGILDSELCSILSINITDIDIKKCDIDANKNLLKEVCEFYNTHKEMTPPMIAPIFKVRRQTILNYLKKGTDLGLCSYDVKKAKIESRFKGAKIVGELKSKPVEVFYKESSIGIFKKANNVVKYFDVKFSIKLNSSNISAACRGQYKHHKGYAFKYITKEEYESRPQDQRDLPEDEI